jgi:hypothetical protein
VLPPGGHAAKARRRLATSATRYLALLGVLERFTALPSEVVGMTLMRPGNLANWCRPQGQIGDQLACLAWLGAALATRKVAGGSNLTTLRSYDHAGVTEARERADKGLCKSIAFR